ncbi:zinc finger protein 106 [Myripristis murdjan]|uniref:Zinc finger protein 106-like n=1 Tax=Myripristis murdjan TaxID=586833 RepID=A0A667XM99_9TELE|nr:zinc finger protein 106-like [Myripristis murdjan]
MAKVEAQVKMEVDPPVDEEEAAADHKDKNSKSKVYCMLCRKTYLKSAAHEHMHSMLHHRELETVLGRDSFHTCQACESSSMGLNEYAQHVSTPQHKAKLRSLMNKKSVKPVSLFKTLSPETIARIFERNKMLKKTEKKAMKKRKKKIKQESAQRHAQTSQHMAKTKQWGSKPTNQKKWKQQPVKTLAQPEQVQQKGSSKGLIQNKENRVFARLLSQQPSQAATLQNQSGGFPSREHPGGVWHYPHLQTSYSQPDHHLRFDDNFFVNTHVPEFNRQPSEGREGSSHTDRFVKRPKNTPGSGADRPYQRAMEDEFTSDQLPQKGAIIFDHFPDKSKGSFVPSPRQDPQCSSARSAASASQCLDRSLDAGSTRDVDIGAMLWQIRRTLGVREPCRADREARSQKQGKEVSVQQVDGSTVQHPLGGSLRDSHTEEAASSHSTPHDASRPVTVTSTKTPSAQSLQASANAPATPLGASTPKVKAKQRSLRGSHEEAPQVEKSTDSVSDSDRQSNSREQETEGESATSRLGTLASLNRSMAKTTSAEPNLNAARRIRHVSETRRTEGEREAGMKVTLQKLLSLSGSKSKVNWQDMYQEVNRKKQEKVKGMPRFGIELVNPLSDQESLTRAEDEDVPLSEGFHWELAFPDDPPPAHWPLAPLSHSATENDSLQDGQADSRTQEPPEPPGTALGADSSIPPTAAGSVKVESNSEKGSNGQLAGNVSAKKKHKADDGVANIEPSGKKRKTKSNKDQGQIDQLLAVSLREEELSHSLQDVDSSLLQARGALQAAYAEVQRLLLLKQQFHTEVNSLRAKRIEILQEMQDGYSGVSSVGEKTSALSAGAAPTVSPKRSSLSSSSPLATSSIQQPSSATSASVISRPHLASLAVINIKQEIDQPPTNEQASEAARIVTCSTAVPQRPSSQVLPVVPPVLLPSLLLTSNSAVPLLPPRAESSTSANTSLSPDTSIKQSEPEMREGFRDEKIKGRGTLSNEEAQATNRDTEELRGGNLSEEHHKVLEPIRDKDAPTLVLEDDEDESAAAQDNRGGDESDSSVEMTEPSSKTNLEVIAIEESDNENVPETASKGPGHPEASQKSACVDLSSASTQTVRLKVDKTERKSEAPAASVKDTKIPPESGAVAEDEELFLGTFESHAGPVHGLQVHEGLLYTCSGDNTARAYSLTSRECQMVFDGHTNKVNCLLVSSLPNLPARLYTGSSDQTIRCYSLKSRKCLEQISLPDRVLCLHIAWNILYAGLANGSVVSYDLKTLKQLDVFECHGPRGVSCLDTAQEGARRVLLVGSYDSTISVRDAKSGLLLRSLRGHTKTVLCMKVVNDLVFSGSSDTSVHAHNVHTGELVRIYKGHGHSVTSIAILGKVMVTACLDKLVRVYELQSHNRLQVYGGHSDMVMCMAIHKSVIYTGCYDGSVQAVKLNLMENYRCWWLPCSLIFGVGEHLIQHLLKDHSNPQLQTVKCRWRGCNAFFATQDAVKQELPEHMRSHMEQDSKM